MIKQHSRPSIALCSEYQITVRGGVSVLVEEIIAGLSGDFDFWLVSPDDQAEIRSLPVFSHLAGHIQFQLSCHPPQKAFRRAAEGLAKRLDAEGVQLAHFHAGGTFGWGNRWPGASVPKFCADAGLKTLWTTHLTEAPSSGYFFRDRPHWISRLLSPLAVAGKTSQMRTVDAEIAVSEHDKTFLARNFPGAANKLRRVYHSRLEADLPEPRESRQPMVLAVGHIAFRKGQDVLVRAFLDIAPLFPDWELVLAGHDAGGGCWQQIERMRANHPAGSRVRLLGAHQHPMELMATASLFVQPSREEALGLALQEALFLGCPAIGSRVGGIPEVIDEGQTGILVELGDVRELSAALAMLIGDQPLRTMMGSRGRGAILAKGMTRQKMMEAHRALYLKLLPKL